MANPLRELELFSKKMHRMANPLRELELFSKKMHSMANPLRKLELFSKKMHSMANHLLMLEVCSKKYTEFKFLSAVLRKLYIYERSRGIGSFFASTATEQSA